MHYVNILLDIIVICIDIQNKKNIYINLLLLIIIKKLFCKTNIKQILALYYL